MEEKPRVIIVTGCKDCPYSSLVRFDWFYCHKEDKEYCGSFKFPPFCPLLENVEEWKRDSE